MKAIFTLFSVLFGLFASTLLAQVPALSSNPSSNFVLLIDMDGHTDNSGWWGNGVVVAASPNYNTAQATEVFNRVAEDFRPFDINVTTQESVYNAVPVANRQRVVVTPTDGWFNTGSGPIAGGVAYLFIFGGGEIASWVFSNRLGNTANVAEAASHELGHTLGLNHQSRYDANCNKSLEYHSGQGSGQTNWGPLMGTGYGRTISLWYNGPGNGATCTSRNQNDLEIITTINGFDYRTDDVGNTSAAASTVSFAGNQAQVTSIISTRTDVDVFRISVSSSQVYRILGKPFAHNSTSNSGANLDVKLTVSDVNGNILAQLNPTSTLDVSVDLFLQTGDYFIAADGSGVPNYIAIGGIGPEDYGSLGQYTITVSGLSCTAGLISSVSPERCGNGALTLTATPSVGGTVSWFSNISGGSSIGSGNTFQTPSLSETATYYAEVSNGTCTSERIPVNGSIFSSPTLSPIGGSIAVQVGNSIQLTQAYQFGVWGTDDPLKASVSTSGLVNGISAGEVVISYSATVGVCPTVSVTKQIAVTSAVPCPGVPTISDVDGNTYNTIQIGNQCWTKENLKTTKFADASPISAIPLANEWSSTTNPAWCYLNNNSQLNNTYGKLYNWKATVTTKGLCPAGWHVPERYEYDDAIQFLGGSELAGGKMKSTTLWSAPNTGGSDLSGFRALPGGFRNDLGQFGGQSTQGGFQTVNSGEGNNNIIYLLNHNSSQIGFLNLLPSNGLSVRCIQDDASGALPFLEFTNGGATCGTGRVFLSAWPSKGFVAWYANPTGGNPIAYGTSFQTPLLETSTTYYAEAVYGVNVSATRTPVTALVKPEFNPGNIGLVAASICNGGNPENIVFTVEPVTGDNLLFQWYFKDGIAASPTGTTQGWTLIQGATLNSYDPPAGLSSSRTYAVFVSPRSSEGTGQPVGGSVCGIAQWAAGRRQITVNAIPTTPIVTSNGPISFCQGGSVILSSGIVSGNLWSNGATTLQISVGNAGSFSVRTISAGCTSAVSNTVAVSVNPNPTASISPGGATTFCSGGSVNLTASGGVSYLWTPGGQTSEIISVNTSGIFSVAVTNANGCTANTQTTVTVNQATIPEAGSDRSLNINSGNVQLTGSPSGGIWSGLGVTSQGSFSTTQAAGNYNLQYCFTNGQGCTACDNVIISLIDIVPVQVATPVISPGTGTYTNVQTVNITCATPGATIYYTLTGNIPLLNPFPNSFTRIYTGPIAANANTTIRAIATLPGSQNSFVALAVLSITNPTIVGNPVISPNSGTFEGSAMVSISTPTPGATIYYTTNGNLPLLNPFPNSFTRIYSNPFTIIQTSTIRAIALKEGMTSSGIVRANINVNSFERVQSVVFSPPPGAYVGSQSIAMTTSTPGSTIYYTTNGNSPLLTPFPNSFTRIYSSPIIINGNSTLRALATRPGFQGSSITVGIYTLALGRQAMVEENEYPLYYESTEAVKPDAASVQVFPNPTSGQVKVISSGDLKLSYVEVYNSLGAKVFETDVFGNEKNLQLDKVPSGIYLIRIHTSAGLVDKKIIKQ